MKSMKSMDASSSCGDDHGQFRDPLQPPFDLPCPVEGLTTLNGMVMEDIAPMTRFIVYNEPMLQDTNHDGLIVTTYIGIREPHSRMAIHMHPYGGQTCVISGPPSTVFIEGQEPREYPAGTC
jgi:hypothetical protein